MTDGLPLLYAVMVAAVFLGIQGAAMYWLGQRCGRRSSPETGDIVARAVLWSFVLSWTAVIGSPGHGAVVLLLPAWLVLVLWIGGGSSTAGVPPAWLAIACSLCAYVVGAMRGRSRSSHSA